jgi:hypothetical protein
MRSPAGASRLPDSGPCGDGGSAPLHLLIPCEGELWASGVLKPPIRVSLDRP